MRALSQLWGRWHTQRLIGHIVHRDHVNLLDIAIQQRMKPRKGWRKNDVKPFCRQRKVLIRELYWNSTHRHVISSIHNLFDLDGMKCKCVFCRIPQTKEKERIIFEVHFELLVHPLEWASLRHRRHPTLFWASLFGHHEGTHLWLQFPHIQPFRSLYLNWII